MTDQKRPNDEEARNQKLADAEYYIKEAYKILQDETTRLRQEQEVFDAMSKKLEHVHFSSTVKLNVGGHTFTTSVQTLKKDPDSMLAAMFSGKFDTKPAEDGAFFIDRDGTHFRFILNYLRTGKLTLPEGATFLKELAEEAEFYQIQGIIDELKSPESAVQASKPTDPFEDSEILTNEEHRRKLISWLPHFGAEWRLLYRASRDGFRAATFHARCDDKGPIVTIVKSGNNIFGGFMEELCQSDFGGYKTFTQTFLFSLVNPQGLGPTLMPLKNEMQGYAIYYKSNYGPTFGEGHDLYISDDANRNTKSYSKLGRSYACPPGQHYKTFFTGRSNFAVTNYEVFRLY